MKKLAGILFLAFTAATAVFLLFLYFSASSPIEERQLLAEEAALEEFDLSEISDISFFHGTVSYQVIDGVNSEGEEIYLWMPEVIEEPEEEPIDELNEADELESEEDPPAEPLIRLHTEGITEEEALETLHADADIAEVRSVRLGVIQASPVYEINYRDTSGRFGFYYLAFEDGQYLRRYELAS